MEEICFTVHEDETGGYYAHAKSGTHDLFTQADTLDELRANLQEVTLLYLEARADETGEPVPDNASYKMRLAALAR